MPVRLGLAALRPLPHSKSRSTLPRPETNRILPIRRMSMKAQSGISLNNAAVAATPKHLLQFAVDQRYDDYTSVDHAVWRFIMRQNVFFLREYAHKVYFQGLLDTGISFERIPQIEEATKLVEQRQKNLGEPSEMALLSRLHWWTVEYGLIGTLENPKIYGAGLLSSIGESVSCLEPAVKKIPYSIDAMNQPFDITTKQPQLFVCRDFEHLRNVLEEFAGKLAYQVGGLEGINKAIECKNTATCEYSSGLQVSGVFTEVLSGKEKQPIYLRTTGKTALAFKDKELPGHGIDYHKDGFGSPIG